MRARARVCVVCGVVCVCVCAWVWGGCVGCGLRLTLITEVPGAAVLLGSPVPACESVVDRSDDETALCQDRGER